MTSLPRIEAARRNGRKSRGPRTAAGKAIASANALRHGLATVSRGNPAFAQEIERIARAICGEAGSPQLFARALAVAESDLLLRLAAREHLAVIERMLTRASSVTQGGARTRIESWRQNLPELQYTSTDTFAPQTPKRPANQNSAPLVHALVPAPDSTTTGDELDAMQQAMPQLARLERYRRRAWSRRKQAMRTFIEWKSCERYLPETVSIVEADSARSL